MSVCEPTSRKLLVRTAWGPPGLATAADGTRGRAETGGQTGPSGSRGHGGNGGVARPGLTSRDLTWSLDALLQGEEQNELLRWLRSEVSGARRRSYSP